MVISKASMTQWPEHRELRFTANAYHVEVVDKDGNTLFKRGGSSDLDELWLDEKHRTITDALEKLESAIDKALR